MGGYGIAAFFLILGVCLIILGRRGRSGFPRGQVVYIDSARLEAPASIFSDAALGLSGRPDYLIRHRRQVIPVEAKSSLAPDQPYEGHILQLAAYCRLVQSSTGRRPSHGIIHYRDRSFRIDNTPALQRSLISLLQEIQSIGDTKPARSHNHAARCRACSFQAHCDQGLRVS
jgi:CRISPR-associated exonuclease Cas4